MHITTIPHEPILGFLGGFFSAGLLWIADVAPQSLPVPEGVIQLGGTVGLIGFLSYGCVTLWKQLQIEKNESAKERERHQDQISNLHNEILGETRRQNNELIAVLKKLDPDKQ
jgi:hypothetical protein